jgi:hypothetical protein
VTTASWASREGGAAADFPLWVMSHLSAIPLRAHLSETSLSTGTLGAYPQVAVPPCSLRCQLVP